MVSTSFISTNAAAIGHYLPVSKSDTGKLALLAYIRLFDAQMLVIISGFPVAYGIVTGSLIGALACLGVFLINVGLAVTVMLLLALYFHTRIQSSGGSRLNSIVRVLFIVLWAVAIMGFSLSFQLLGMIIPLIESFAIIFAPIWSLLYFGYPFSMGTFVVFVTGVPGTPPFWLAIVIAGIYGLLAFAGIRWARNFLTRIGTGGIVAISSGEIRPANVKVSRVGIALLRKDFRIATRTPGQAIMFFLPILMIVPIFLQFIWDSGVVFVSDVLIFIAIPTVMMGFFSIFFLSVEARGMAYTITLPLKTERILRSKAQLITFIAVAIPLFVAVISFFRPFTNPVSYLIAFSQIPVVYVSAYISLIIFTRIIGGGRLTGFEIGKHISQMLVVGFLRAFIAFIPILLFGLFWFVINLLGYSVQIAHIVGLVGMWVGIGNNYVLGKLFAKRLLRD